MADKKNDNLFNEHLEKIKHRVDYKINESARYRPLVSNEDEYDDVPEITNEAGEQEDVPKPEGSVPPAPSNDEPINTDAPVPAFDQPEAGEDENIPPEGELPPEEMAVEPDDQVEEIQNDIIKHNIEAMKSIQFELESLSNTVQTLNSKIDTLNDDVEEVREPSNTEKLMNKGDVSYPYYFNLNNMWSNNWFQNKHKTDDNQYSGMKELPDGTYIADFDDLPSNSSVDINDSFNKMT